MATSGSFRTSAYDSRCLEFAWTRKSYSIPDNTTTISWTLTARGKGQHSQYNAGNFLVVIDGIQKYFSSARITTTDGLLIASGEHTFTHLTDGTKSFTVYVEAGIYTYAVNCSGSDVFALDNIPRAATIISANNVTDEQNPSFTFSNPGGFDLVAELEINPANTHLFTRTVPDTGSFTFQLTEAERNTLRSYITGSNTATLRYLLYSNNDQFVSYVDKTITIVNGEPTLNPVVYDDYGPSLELTNNPNSMIRYFNDMLCEINATARKGASIVSQSVSCGGLTSTDNTGSLANVGSNSFVFTATDSRGNTVTKTITLPMVNYIPLTCDVDANVSLSESDGTKAEIEFTVSGNYFQGSFGAVSNTLKLSYSLEYEGGGISINPLTIPESAFSDGTYSLTYKIPNELDYKKSYIIRIYAEDKINTDVQSSSKTLKAVPVFDWGENDFNFNVPVKINGVEIDYIVEQGEKNGWFYRKWNSGAAECWYSAMVNDIWQGEFEMDGFYYCGSKGVNFPFTFKSVAYTNATGGSTGNMNIVRPFNFTNTYMTYIVIGNADLESVDVRINLEAKGKWR